ncbi:MAG: hypothetical protein HKM88_09235 [Halobacteria archaeon]|nr:hypothetical protein [Halobacteria archaeon]
MDWQHTLQTIKQYAFPRKAALERELSAARVESQALSAELQGVRTELQDTLSKDAQQIAELRKQLGSVQFEHSAARHQAQLLEASLEQAGQRQASTEQQLRSLEHSLEQEQSQARLLEESLQQATQRQASTEQKLVTLESKLEQERRQHETSLDMTRETFALLQAEQQNLLSLQSDQARAFNDVGRQLLEAMQAVTARPPRPLFQIMAVASLLFLCATLVGVVTMRGLQEDGGELAELADLNLGIRDMQVSMEQSFSEQNEILTGLIEALNRETAQAGMSDAVTLKEDESEETPVSEPLAAPVGIKPGKRSANDKWGPLLLMEDTQVAGTTGELVFDPQVKEQQADLMVLGFNLGQQHADGLKGRQTEKALEEFKLLYLPLAGMDDAPGADQLTPVIKRFADAAREDEKNYQVDSGVLAAIRLGSMHTDMDFSFLMELAAVESSFNPLSRAQTSSAAGLYQFKNDTWLEVVRKYGDKYGIGLYASQVEEVVNSKGKNRPVIRDPAVQRHVLELRHNPRIAALLAAEYVKQNMQRLLYSLDREPGRTELYLTHFLGASGAISFLKALHEDPDRIARDVFPSAASRNQSIFRKRDSKPRTLAEIYKIFSRRFNTSRYEEG